MSEKVALRVALTMPRRLPFKSTDRDYLYQRLPQLASFVPVEIRGHSSLLTYAAVSARFALRRAGMTLVDSWMFGSDLLMPIGRLPACDVVFSYGFFPRFRLDWPVVWEQTFASATYDADADAWRSRLQRDYREAVVRATRIVTATDYSADVFREHFPNEASKVAVVPYFFPQLDIRREEEVSAKYEGDGPVEVLFVGKAARRKGLDTLCSALRLLPPERRAQLRVTAVSALLDGPVDFPPDVVHHAFVPNLNALFRRAHVFVFPTKEEAFGLVLVEAMAAGCAVITTSNPLQVSIVGERGGMFVDPHDPIALSRALDAIVEDRSGAARMGAHNRQRADEIFGPKVVAERLYEELERAKAEHG